jgi:sugar lactone lactonase YvrE
MTSRAANAFADFAPGDVFAAATLLDDPKDDHAGLGRILQFDADLKEKAAFTTSLTTHLVQGLTFDRDGRLWAFDSQSFVVLTLDADGRVEKLDLAPRPFSNANFLRDGSVFLGEHLVGSELKPEIAARMGTRFRYVPGTARFGDGHVFHYSKNGRLLKEYATQVHGGMGGFLGVTGAAVSPDESTLYYVSETGPRLMRYDLANDQQLPDLLAYPEGRREMFFGLAFASDGSLLVSRGARIDALDPRDGSVQRSYALEGSGWATIAPSTDGKSLFAGNFFTGELAKIELGSGAKVASAQVGVAKSLAGIAQYAG